VAPLTAPVLAVVSDEDLGGALADGYRVAMLAMAGLGVASAPVAALFVSDHPSGAPQMVPSPRVPAAC
jgi:hypothetical protein